MSAFKARLKYENPSYEEFVEFEAENTAMAESVCSGFLKNYTERLLRLKHMNVYVSRRMVSCDLLARHWREDLMCLSRLEDKV